MAYGVFRVRVIALLTHAHQHVAGPAMAFRWHFTAQHLWQYIDKLIVGAHFTIFSTAAALCRVVRHPKIDSERR